MPAPHSIIPRLEGMIGTLQNALPAADTARPLSPVATWVEMCKAIMRQPALRDQTDWEIYVADGVIQTGTVLDSTTGTLYAALVRQDASDAEADFVAFYDAGAVTLDGTAALANTALLVLQPPATGTNNISEWHPMAFPQGIPYTATGLSVSADGRDGTNPGATDITVHVLVRT